MIHLPVSQHWINWHDKALKFSIAVVWQEPWQNIDPSRAERESRKIYDFFSWCVHHEEEIQALREAERSKGNVPEGLCDMSIGSGGGVGVPVVSEGGRENGHR